MSNAKHACRHPALTGRSGTPSSDLPTNERQRLFYVEPTLNRSLLARFESRLNPKQLIDGRFTSVFSVTLLCLRFTIRMCLWALFYGPIQVLTLSIYHFGERFYAFGYDNSASLTRLPLPTLSFARIHFKNDRIELMSKTYHTSMAHCPAQADGHEWPSTGAAPPRAAPLVCWREGATSVARSSPSHQGEDAELW